MRIISVMRQYLIIIVIHLFVLFSSCSEDSEFREQDNTGSVIWSANPTLYRGNRRIDVLINNPGFIVDYFSDTQDPDYFVVLYSNDNIEFKDSVTAEYYESKVELKNLINNVPYYVKARTYKEGFERIESSTFMTIPGSSGSIKNTDFRFTADVERFSISPNGQYLAYLVPGDDRIIIQELETGVKKIIDVEGRLGGWNSASDQFVFVSRRIRDDRVYDTHFIIYNTVNSTLDTILELDQTVWSHYTPQFRTSENEIVFRSDFKSTDPRYSELFSLNLSFPNEIRQLSDFEEDEFILWSVDDFIESDQVLISGYRDVRDKSHFYFYNLKTDVLELIEKSPFSHSNPTLSRDGRFIAFASYRSGSEYMWVYDIQSKAYRQVTDQTINLNYRSFEWKDDNEIYVTEFRNEQNNLKILKF